jgi:hypothetical protein
MALANLANIPLRLAVADDDDLRANHRLLSMFLSLVARVRRFCQTAQEKNGMME